MLLSALFSFNSFASPNIKGYAVYRQGNFPNPSGHAGLVYNSNIDDPNSIIHVITGDDNDPDEDDYLIHITSFDYFKDGQTFYGYYVPFSLKSYNNVNRRLILNDVIYMASLLKNINKNILSYNVLYQVWYTTDKDKDEIVDYHEISSMRCDGLVEYCYEYYGLSVYAGNISTFDTTIRNVHVSPNITPKQQIKHYLQNCLGDIDGDLTVTSSDSRLASRYSVGLETFGTYQLFVGDVSGNGYVTSEDARLILRYATGLDSSFPADPFPPS